jgi:putative addiction module CopG family antidote
MIAGMDVHLTREAEAVVKAEIASGEFPTAEAVVAASLRLLRLQRDSYWDTVRALVAEGIDDLETGEEMELDADSLESIKREGRALRRSRA